MAGQRDSPRTGRRAVKTTTLLMVMGAAACLMGVGMQRPLLAQGSSGGGFQCSVDDAPVPCDWLEFCLLDGGVPTKINGEAYCCHGRLCEGVPETASGSGSISPARPAPHAAPALLLHSESASQPRSSNESHRAPVDNGRARGAGDEASARRPTTARGAVPASPSAASEDRRRGRSPMPRISEQVPIVR